MTDKLTPDEIRRYRELEDKLDAVAEEAELNDMVVWFTDYLLANCARGVLEKEEPFTAECKRCSISYSSSSTTRAQRLSPK